MAEQFKMYLNSLPPDKINEIENVFRAHGNGLLSARQTESATELFSSFTNFYYINGRRPYADRHLFVSDGETPRRIIGEKLSLKELFAKFLGQVQSCFISVSCCSPAVFCQKRKASKKFSYRII